MYNYRINQKCFDYTEGHNMKRMKKLAALLLAAAMTMSLAACTKDTGGGGSGSGGDGEQKKETIVFGTSADYAPFEFHKMVNGKDTIMGFDVALAQQIADDLGKELVIKDMDFGNLLTELQNGTVDFVIASMAPNAERSKQVDFSDVYYNGAQCAIIRKEDAAKYTTPESLKGQPIAAQTGSVFEEIAKDQFSGSSLVSLAKVPDMILQLQTNKVEALIMDKETADGYLLQDDNIMIADFKIVYEENGCAVAVQKGNTELLEKINATIKDVTESGKMDEFVEEAKAEAPQE